MQLLLLLLPLQKRLLSHVLFLLRSELLLLGPLCLLSQVLRLPRP